MNSDYSRYASARACNVLLGELQMDNELLMCA